MFIVSWIKTLFSLHSETTALSNQLLSTTKNNGYIYIVVTESKSYKVGRTKDRATMDQVGKYLYSRYRTAYGPNIYFLLYKSNNTFLQEKQIHNRLSSFRVGNSELFTTSLSRIKSICNQCTSSSAQMYKR